MADETRLTESLPHVVIVGGGFGGLAAAHALRRAPVRVTLIDRTNHHLFQPLLYQVATCVLSSVEIAAPIRHLLRRQKNASVEMTAVLGVDPQKRAVSVGQPGQGARPVHYDYLILATGATGSYFGHDEWAKLAPYPKTVADVLTMRDKILKLFELAETEDDPSQHRDLLTFVLVGAGPTGVEMAGALATMTRATLKSEFRRIDPASARIVLVDAGPRILAAYSETLAGKTHRYLRAWGWRFVPAPGSSTWMKTVSSSTANVSEAGASSGRRACMRRRRARGSGPRPIMPVA